VWWVGGEKVDSCRLCNKLETVVEEMNRLGFNHKCTLKKELATCTEWRLVFVDQPERQK
jgi:hypothetical protein